MASLYGTMGVSAILDNVSITGLEIDRPIDLIDSTVR